MLYLEKGLVGGQDFQLAEAVKPGIDQGAADISVAPLQQHSCTVNQDDWKPIKTVIFAVLRQRKYVCVQ